MTPTPAEFETVKTRLEKIIARINELDQRMAEMREVWNERLGKA